MKNAHQRERCELIDTAMIYKYLYTICVGSYVYLLRYYDVWEHKNHSPILNI